MILKNKTKSNKKLPPVSYVCVSVCSCVLKKTLFKLYCKFYLRVIYFRGSLALDASQRFVGFEGLISSGLALNHHGS